MSESYDFLFKFLVIGSAGSGKSCLLHQFIESKFKDDSSHTIGVEFGSKIVNVGGKSVKLQIWDTAGQERFRSVTRSYYRGAAGALLVYDITNRESFNALANWLSDARTLASPNIIILLVGNKKDLDATREITFLEASRFAQENVTIKLKSSSPSPALHVRVIPSVSLESDYKLLVTDIEGGECREKLEELMFLETSAKTGENVEEAFLKCSKTILAKIETGELDPERIGSGIQYGDSSTRRLHRESNRRQPDCICRM
uniref:Ras-related protein Rab-4B n=1 Tax=Timema tahoe TaxID=61484 RepID=A0A7R9FL40_9NEOP|nr:unnamed protein product [Timema tahoe]